MHVSLYHHNVTRVKVGCINFVLTLNKYYKLDVIFEYAKKFLFIPKHFSVEMLLPNAYHIVKK